MPIHTVGFAASASDTPLKHFSFDRRDLGDTDIHIQVKFCGVCHSDLHQVKNEWGNSIYPMVPGHEIVGIITAIGKHVKKFKIGDIGAVGCLVDSCRHCEQCKNNEEQYCPKFVGTYNSRDHSNNPTYGGYSQDIIVEEQFVCRVPDNLRSNLPAVAPLLCAGITTYSPMVRHGMNKQNKKIGIVGLGGLGHMAVQFGKAWGNEITIISSSEKKRKEALETFGVSNFIVSSDASQLKQCYQTLDFIVDTVSAPKDMDIYLNLLKVGGVLVSVALPPSGFTFNIPAQSLILKRKSICGSLIGGIKETQDMLNFCGEKNIVSIIELIKIQDINSAYNRMLTSDVRYRFVIDIEASQL